MAHPGYKSEFAEKSILQHKNILHVFYTDIHEFYCILDHKQSFLYSVFRLNHFGSQTFK